jgi:hypothetical protein
MYTGDGANSGEPGATGAHTSEEKFSMMNCRNASPGEENGSGSTFGFRASILGVYLARKPSVGAGWGRAPGGGRPLQGVEAKQRVGG